MDYPTLARWTIPSRIALRAVAGCIVALTFGALACNAWAQAHETKSGEYILRGSTVSTVNLPPESARANGIERDPRRAVLNVTVLAMSSGAERTVRAEVRAAVRDLAGVKRDIPLREVTENGWVNYLGTYSFNHGEVLDFTLTAQPDPGGKPLVLQFRDRMWARGDLPDVPRQR